MEDDDGFVGYVPSTVDPGPVLLVAVVVTVAFLLVTLPFAVVFGDKYAARRRRYRAGKTEEDGAEQKHVNVDRDDQEDDDSVSSKGTFYSAISTTFKEALDHSGRPIRSARRTRHKRRGRSQAERNHIMQDPDQYSHRLTEPLPSETSDEYIGKIAFQKDSDAQTISDHQENQISESGASEYGVEMRLDNLESLEKPINPRDVCLSMEGFLDEIAAIFAWDIEMKRIIKLSIPL